MRETKGVWVLMGGHLSQGRHCLAQSEDLVGDIREGWGSEITGIYTGKFKWPVHTFPVTQWC